MADAMVVASGRSARHVSALADHVSRKLKEAGASQVRVEGLPNADWVLIDAGDVIVHIFRPEVREFYNLERIWGPDDDATRRTRRFLNADPRLRIRILCIGRMKDGPERELVDDYLARAQKTGKPLGYRAVEEVELNASSSRTMKASACSRGMARAS